MLTGSFALAALAVVLAWPAPLLLAGAAWPSRAPATALVLWQAVALAGGLSMIGALLTFGLVPFGNDFASGLRGLVLAMQGGTFTSSEVLHLAVLTSGVILGGHLLLNLLLTIAHTTRERRRHRALIDLLTSPIPDRPDARLLDSAAPVAYCLPGVFHSLTVFSAGLVRTLSEDELTGVIEHERAHATQRHDLVLVAFRAWHTSLPWFPVANRAEGAVATLTEMLADDHARTTVADATLARAITLVAIGAAGASERRQVSGSAGLPSAISGLGDDAARLAARIGRLDGSAHPIGAVARISAIVAASALIAVPTALLAAPAVADLLPA
ncbi:M56 family metallopeptidase [Naasia lichenicola]|uniref:M56 family metallopeptidase n=1 Tax=Naasia lichenicola TaxID=2565933 RepID=A0A4S4FRD2_9MICO|nr:M56 family metallopeptidase [Naasia lichenicola]THG33189.1 M56 family metallopeptidase [Naasia lichenicola]